MRNPVLIMEKQKFQLFLRERGVRSLLISPIAVPSSPHSVCVFIIHSQEVWGHGGPDGGRDVHLARHAVATPHCARKGFHRGPAQTGLL